MSKLSRKQIFSIAAVLLIVLGLSYILWGGLEQNLVFFVTPSELVAKGKGAVGNPVRLGGVVSPGTVRQEGNLLSFDLKDEHNSVPVMTTKTPPQMFHEGMGVVVEGALQADGRFDAQRLMIKHGNEYRPPKEGEIPQEIFKSLEKEKGFLKNQ